MQDESSIVQVIALAGQGDVEAQQKLWDRYFPQLVRLAQQRIQQKFQRIGDGEDVALSVLKSFFRQIETISLPDVRGGDDLWRLLSRMTQRKAIDWIRFQQRQKRCALGESAVGLRNNTGISKESAADARPMADVVSDELEPQLTVMLIENCELLMAQLPEVLRPIVLLRLAGHTNNEIAASQNCSLATVERRLKLVRSIWSESISEKE